MIRETRGTRVSVAKDSVLFPSAGVQAQPIEGGAVILDGRSGAIYELNRVGLEIWSQICRGTPVGAIQDAIAARYAISPEQSEQDVEKLVAALTQAGLVSNEKPSGSAR